LLEDRCLLSTLSVGRNVNISRLAGAQVETAIAIDPTDPRRLFAVSNQLSSSPGLFAAYSTDGGKHWQDSDPGDGVIADGSTGDPLPPACCDPSVAFDQFGNLFLAYLDTNGHPFPDTVVALSTDGGRDFSVLATFPAVYGTDQPHIATGPGRSPGTGSVWVDFSAGLTFVDPTDFTSAIQAAGAHVTGLGEVGAFSTPESVPNSNHEDFGGIAVGPDGAVIVSFQSAFPPSVGPDTIMVSVDRDGLGHRGFSKPTAAAVTQVGSNRPIPAQPHRTIDAESSLIWDRSGGPHNGRIYLVYTDAPNPKSDDTDIFVRFSDDQGKHWSDPERVNDDTGTNSQFLPRIALDQTTGNIAVTWYDCRHDTGKGGSGDTDGIPNDDAQFWGSVSLDGGATFLPNLQISAGTSSVVTDPNVTYQYPDPDIGFDFGDYTGLAFDHGKFYPIWADNSNSTGDNPNGYLNKTNIYTACVRVRNHRYDPDEISADAAGPPSAEIIAGGGVSGGTPHDAWFA
jgi:hypothetical protein